VDKAERVKYLWEVAEEKVEKEKRKKCSLIVTPRTVQYR